MKNDLNLTFGEIFEDDPNALLDQLIDIQTHTADRKKAEKWVDRLRLIDVSHVPNLSEGGTSGRFAQPRETLVLPLLEKNDDDGEIAYIAVSWRWTTRSELPPWGYSTERSFDYMVQRPGREAHKSQFPDHYFERVIRFAQDAEIDRLWIDKECIFQEDPEDKALGVQIMDAVYEKCTFAVGLLTTPLLESDEGYLLAELLARNIFQDAHVTMVPKYKTYPMMELKLLKIQTLILRILSDSRWSRGWIFQEDHLASNRMKLLIPYGGSVESDTNIYDFGEVPGDLVVELSDFRKAVTMFCLASSENERRWPLSEMLGKAKQYNIFNRYWSELRHILLQDSRNPHRVRHWTRVVMKATKMNENTNYHNEPTFPSTMLSVLDDICHRDLEKTEDRIAVMANAAKFSRRLDTSATSQLVTSEVYSLSAILLALILINGEIMDTFRSMSHKSFMKYTLRQYLEQVQYRFNAPTFRYEQSFINHCRLKESTITRRGVEAPGFLFKLLPNRKPFSSASKPHPLKLTDEDRGCIEEVVKTEGDFAQDIEPGRRFNLLAAEVIIILMDKLRRNYGEECQLAEFIEQHLGWDIESPLSDEALPSTPYVLDMMTGLVQALIDGRELRLARLDGEPDTAEPSAIFVAPYMGNGWFSENNFKETGKGTADTWVFTSWDNGWRSHGMERLASMEVVPFSQDNPSEPLPQWDPKKGSSSFLQSYGWINGVWDVKGKRMNRYTFPITGLTSQHDLNENGGPSRKRKRRSNGAGSSG
ncbi:hypothetical protein E8E13_008160 [Curvularia kusanoi]|uniref:Heterokaryon incompatibility domain-containing protein n=1 Tax=Curvularia kusanoi TaxID=90978 RepID=A0A9P4TF65_CURKU|nr:hypothetical protein E8E13_008160 [Curvularia kusanoi]